MDKTGRYYFLFSLGIKMIVSYFIITILVQVADLYFNNTDLIYKTVLIVSNFMRTFLVLGSIGILGYLLYESYVYYSSVFHSVTKIPVFKAMYLGYFDLAYTYDRLAVTHKKIIIDTKYRGLQVQTEKGLYFILVREYFGTLDGNEKYDPWHIVKGRRKEYGRITYRKQIPVRNPITEANDIRKEYLKSNLGDPHLFIVLAGLTKAPVVDPRFLNVFELESAIK